MCGRIGSLNFLAKINMANNAELRPDESDSEKIVNNPYYGLTDYAPTSPVDFRELVEAEVMGAKGVDGVRAMMEDLSERRDFARGLYDSLDATNRSGQSVKGIDLRNRGEAVARICEFISDKFSYLLAGEQESVPDGCVRAVVTLTGNGWFKAAHREPGVGKSFFVRLSQESSGDYHVMPGDPVYLMPTGKMEKGEGVSNPGAVLVRNLRLGMNQ